MSSRLPYKKTLLSRSTAGPKVVLIVDLQPLPQKTHTSTWHNHTKGSQDPPHLEFGMGSGFSLLSATSASNNDTQWHRRVSATLRQRAAESNRRRMAGIAAHAPDK